MERSLVALGVLLALGAAGCGDPAAEATDGREDDAGLDGGACTSGEVQLRVTREALGPTRLYALATYEGAEVAFLVDTGSQLTFLSHDGPDGTPDVGEVDFGCGEKRTLLGRPIHSAESVDGRPVVGFLGNDFFLEKVREIDLPGERIRVRPDGACPGDWARAPLENRYDYLFVMAQVDGTTLRLGFDTGAAHTLWVGQEGEAGDQVVSSQDAYGNPLTLYLGSAILEVAGEAARTVPIMRTLSFPSFEDSNAMIGGGIDGLLGLTTVGNRRFCIDGGDSSVRFEP